MVGALLDTHALYWLVTGVKELTEYALAAIAKNQTAGTLFVSPITGWELAVASQKPPNSARPQLGDVAPSAWFRAAVAATSAKVIPIKQRIAIEAAAVVEATGHKDPGDCYLVATARVRRVPLITRDHVMLGWDRTYLDVIEC